MAASTSSRPVRALCSPYRPATQPPLACHAVRMSDEPTLLPDEPADSAPPVPRAEHERVLSQRDYFQAGSDAGLRGVERIRELEGEGRELLELLTEAHRMVLTMSGQTTAVIMAVEDGPLESLHLPALREHERAADELASRLSAKTRTSFGDWVVDGDA